MTNAAPVTVFADTAHGWRSSVLLPATPAPHPTHATPHGVPVPFSAHETPRAIRVRRSPR